MRKLPPSFTEQELRQNLQQLAATEMDWTKDDDARVKGDLGRLVQKLDRMRRLKSGGIESFKDYSTIHANLQYVVARCKTFGLFLVPVGELEYWAPALINDGPGKSKKAEWANHAAMKVRQEPNRAPDLLQFMREMAAYHNAEAYRMA
jgi:hypothetical protein